MTKELSTDITCLLQSYREDGRLSKDGKPSDAEKVFRALEQPFLFAISDLKEQRRKLFDKLVPDTEWKHDPDDAFDIFVNFIFETDDRCRQTLTAKVEAAIESGEFPAAYVEDAVRELKSYQRYTGPREYHFETWTDIENFSWLLKAAKHAEAENWEGVIDTLCLYPDA